MCGLCGCAGTLEKEDHGAFGGLLFVSSFRGTDSTGMAGRSARQDEGEISIIKATLPSPEFLDLNKVKNLITDTDELMLGHCRSRTVGDINKKNAQPFDMENVCGTHNGTLEHATKNRLEGPGVNCSVDSEALYLRMSKDGLEQMLTFTTTKDAMALVWYDKQEHTINFYRNNLRPLFYCYSADRKRVFWASEAGMLYLILNRANIKFEKVRLLPENLHWSQKLPAKRGQAFGKPTTRFLHQPKPVATTHYSSGTTFHISDSRACGAEVLHLKDYTKPGSAAASADVLRQLKAPIGGIDLEKFRLNKMVVRRADLGGNFYKSDYSLRSFTREMFDLKMGEGCCICGCNPSFGEPVKFLRDDNVLCSSCIAEARGQAESGQMDGNALLILNQLN